MKVEREHDPAASDSPEDPMVCTMLFSRTVPFLRTPLSMAIDMTAAGMDALTVVPVLRPRNAFAAPKTTPMTMPRMSARSVNLRHLHRGGAVGHKRSIFFRR
jgi:hypothetical protein